MSLFHAFNASINQLHIDGSFTFIDFFVRRRAPIRVITFSGKDIHLGPAIVLSIAVTSAVSRCVVTPNTGRRWLSFITTRLVNLPKRIAHQAVLFGPPFVRFTQVQPFFNAVCIRRAFQLPCSLLGIYLFKFFPVQSGRSVFRPFCVIGLSRFQITPSPNGIIPVMKRCRGQISGQDRTLKRKDQSNGR